MLTQEQRQYIFDTGVGGIIEQGGPSVDKNNIDCRYRGEGGRKCVIGHLIADEHYNESFEGAGMLTGTNETWEVLRGVAATTGFAFDDLVEESDLFLGDLQLLHDNDASILKMVFEPDKFVDRARKFAKNWNLNSDILESASK